MIHIIKSKMKFSEFNLPQNPRIAYLIILFILSFLPLKASNLECKLDDLKMEKTNCSADQTFYAIINFKHDGTSDCFTLEGNGSQYGQFLYSDLPIKIGPLKGNCETNYEFLIKDCHNENCVLEGSLGKVCCEKGSECKLYEPIISKSPCDAKGEFLIKVKFQYQNISDSFNVFDHTKKYLGRFSYVKLPVLLGPFSGDCHTNYRFIIRDYKNERCALELEIGTVCCTPNQDCKLEGLKIEKTSCTPEKEFYTIINFQYKNTSECFTLSGNGHQYGSFNYSQLPLKIGPLKANCETNYEFVVRDCKNERCSIEGNLGKVCCETGSGDCQLSGLKMVKTACNVEKEFFTYINFVYRNNSECFTIKGNGHDYGTFKYSQLPLKIGPLKGNCETEYEFAIRDCKNEHCALEGNLGKVCCEGTGSGRDCNISGLNVTRSECSEEGLFYVKLNFNYKNTSECFVVKQNDHILGKFEYNKLPIELGPFKGDCTTEYYFS
ncbi:MAG: hypothetical protein IT267_09095, partial [Saprospiraceae bacterium]|nr:hypothetical protein [Saprospiraceae bacterium]